MNAAQPQPKSQIEQTKDLAIIAIFGTLFLIALWISKHFHISLMSAVYWTIGLPLVGGGTFFTYTTTKKFKKKIKITGPKLHVGEWIQTKWFGPRGPAYIPLKDLRNILITGISGSGKSTLIRRIMAELNRIRRGYLYIDFKGEERELNEILRSIQREGLQREVQIFDLSVPEKCAKCNLLTIFVGIEETVGFAMKILDFQHDHFRTLAEELMTNSLYLLDEVDELRSFVNLRRIAIDDKYRATLLRRVPAKSQEETFYSYFEAKFNLLEENTREERFTGYVSKLNSLCTGAIKEILNAKESVFDVANLFDSNRPTIIRIPGGAYGELSKRIVKAFIGALPVLIARRRLEVNPKDYFVFMDEQCSYSSETIVDILKTAGSSKVHCVLTRQSDGDFINQGPGTASQVISTCSLSFNFQILDADTRDSVSKQLGTSLSTKQTWKINQGSTTGEASEREVHQFEIPPDTFLRLKPGECVFTIRLPDMNFNRMMKVLPVDLSEKEEG